MDSQPLVQPAPVRFTYSESAVSLGTVVKPYGKVASVASIQGERYYFLIDKRQTVSMMPADLIESSAALAEPSTATATGIKPKC